MENKGMRAEAMEAIPNGRQMREQIKLNRVPLVEVAEALNMTRQGLEYHLSRDRGMATMDRGIYERIKKVISDKKRTSLEINEGTFYPVHSTDKGGIDMNEIDGYQFFEYKRKDHCRCIKIKTDEMQDLANPRTINKGDIILIDEKEKLYNGDIALVVTKDDRLLIRKMNEMKEYIELISFNKSYPPIKIVRTEIKDIFKVCLVQSAPRVL